MASRCEQITNCPYEVYSDFRGDGDNAYHFSALGSALLISALIISIILAIHGGAVGRCDPTALDIARWTAASGGIAYGVVVLYHAHKICTYGWSLTELFSQLFKHFTEPFVDFKRLFSPALPAVDFEKL